MAKSLQEMVCVLQCVPDLVLLSQLTDVWCTDLISDTMFGSKIAPNYFCLLLLGDFERVIQLLLFCYVYVSNLTQSVKTSGFSLVAQVV